MYKKPGGRHDPGLLGARSTVGRDPGLWEKSGVGGLEGHDSDSFGGEGQKSCGNFICDNYLSSESEGPVKIPYPTGSESASRTLFVNHICIFRSFGIE